MDEKNKTEILANGLTRQKLHDEKIVVYTVSSIAREVIDLWISEMEQEIGRSPKDHAFFTLYDVSHKDMSFTPYIRRKMETFSKKYPHTTGSTAIVLKVSVMTRIVRLFIEREMRRLHKKQQIHVFFNREDALAWLESGLASQDK